MNTQKQQLKGLIRNQDFEYIARRDTILEKRKKQISSHVNIDNGIAVLSDLIENISYIFSGSFGRNIGLTQSPIVVDSVLVDQIFSCIIPEDKIERNVLELRFSQFQKTISIEDRKNFNTICPIHFKLSDSRTLSVMQRTYFLENLSDGEVWLTLCSYTPYINNQFVITGQIVNNMTGEIIHPNEYKRYDRQLLSTIEKEILILLAKGIDNKKVAEILSMPRNSVYKLRENILTTLKVNSATDALLIANRLNIL